MKIQKTKPEKGFSLIELLVVLAIIAILSVAALSGLRMLGGWQVKQCTRQINAALGEAQLNTMSKKDTRLTISRDTKGNYEMWLTDQEKIAIADEKISIYYVTEELDTECLITEDNPLEISFERSSGAYQPIQSLPAVYVKQIVIRLGDKKASTIRLVRDTGRHYIE